MAIVIRPYHPTDFKELVQSFAGLQKHIVSIDKSHYYRVPRDFDSKKYAKAFVQEIKKSNSKNLILIAEVDGKIAGYIIIVIELASKKEQLEFYAKKKGEILELYLHSQFRKLGLGSQLMNAAEKYCKQQGCDWIRLSTLIYNVAALQFYQKHNYKEHGIEFLKKL